MTPDLLFSITNTTAVVGWLALRVFPRRRWTFTIAGLVLPAIFAVLYIAIVATNFFSSDGSFSTLAGVSTLFSNPWVLLGGWLHYLAFDSADGTWEVRDAQTRGVPHLLVVAVSLPDADVRTDGLVALHARASALRRRPAERRPIGRPRGSGTRCDARPASARALFERAYRFVNPFCRQLKRPEMHADALARAEIEVRPDRFGRA